MHSAQEALEQGVSVVKEYRNQQTHLDDAKANEPPWINSMSMNVVLLHPFVDSDTSLEPRIEVQ